MFCIVYEFKVKFGFNSQFEKSWADFTEAIFSVSGSLGSRLHKTSDSQTYVAYAQWPSKEAFESARATAVYSEAQLAMRDQIRSTLDNVDTVYEMNMIDDHLR